MGDTTSSAALRFLERYGRYFNGNRLQGIRNLGFFVVEGPAEGPYFHDGDGRRYLDMWCMGGTFSLGHRHPAVLAAAEKALREEDFGSLFFFSEAKGRLAEKLAQCTPGRLETTHPVVTGGEAVDLAIQLARGSTGRTEILHADLAYHGCTGFALSMMARRPMRDFPEPRVPDFREVRYGDADDLSATISERTLPIRGAHEGPVGDAEERQGPHDGHDADPGQRRAPGHSRHRSHSLTRRLVGRTTPLSRSGH